MRRLRASIAVLVVAVVAVGAGCSDNGGPGEQVVLDGRPRVPDVEGVVQVVSRDRLVLDGGRRYDVADKPQSFSTYTLATVSLLGRKGQYVQVGLDGDVAVWVASIGAVTELGGKPTVVYTGKLESVDGGRAVFEDGTVLRLASGVTSPVRQGFVRAEIDPSTHEVRALVVP